MIDRGLSTIPTHLIPPLLSVVLKVLGTKITEEKEVNSVQTEKDGAKLSLVTIKLLLCIADLKNYKRKLLENLSFSDIAGYKINFFLKKVAYLYTIAIMWEREGGNIPTCRIFRYN